MVMPLIIIIPHLLLIFYPIQDCYAAEEDNVIETRSSTASKTLDKLM